MAPPTPDKIYDYLATALLSDLEGHVAYEWTFLTDRVWRFHRTTSNAVDKRMRELVQDGRLVALRVDCSGLVFLPPSEKPEDRIAATYFTYHKSHEWAKEEYGTVSIKRTPNRENLWRSGVRHLYMTKAAYEVMIADLTAKSAAKWERQRQRSTDERARLKDALTTLAPDAIEVLNRLRMQVPDLRVEPRLSPIDRLSDEGPEEVTLSIHVYDQAAFLPLLDILRRGLPPQEG